MEKDNELKISADLRQEEALKMKLSKTGSQLSVLETLKLIQKLEFHQAALECQHEELMKTKAHAKVAAEKYTELFDFTALGYFTLTDKGEIIEINLSGANMPGIVHRELRKLGNYNLSLLLYSSLLIRFYLKLLIKSIE